MPDEPQPRRFEGFRRRVGLVRTTSFWSRLGAGLGLVATLWATLIGQTVPELIASGKSPVLEFRASANRICGVLPQSKGYVTPNRVSASRPARPLHLNRVRANEAADNFFRRTAAPVANLADDFSALVPPEAYRSLFPRFQQALVAASRSLYEIDNAVFDLSANFGSERQLAALARVQTAYRAVVSAIFSASLMRLDRCEGALSTVTDGLDVLNDRLGAPR